MRTVFPSLFVFFLLVFVFSCKKDAILTDPSAKLSFSLDTVLFDTVFTTIGSSTRRLKVYNPNNKKVIVSSIRIAGGPNSKYRMNVDGMPGAFLNDIEIPAKDSLFIFIEVTIDPLNSNSPLIVTDSIMFVTNGNEQDVDLVAWGQDAHYFYPDNYVEGLPPYSIICNTNSNTTWVNDKPYVIYGYAVVDSSCGLTIQAGARIHFHNNSGLWIYKGGSIKVLGTLAEPVTFQGDRLEPYYREIPGQWDRIWINESSVDNEFNYAIIKNGFIGIQAETLESYMGNQLTLNNTIIRNMEGIGLLTRFYKIAAANMLIANCGQYATALTLGGDYDFRHCTFANYWSLKSRKTPSLLISNYYEDENGVNQVFSLTKADFKNCIIYGNNENEVLADNGGGTFNYDFSYSLLKTNQSLNGTSIFTNIDPGFVDASNRDFKLKSSSFAIDMGDPAALNKPELMQDLNGNNRGTPPDLGAYEYVP